MPQSSTLDLMQSLEISAENTPDLDSIRKSTHFSPYTSFKEALQTPHYYWFRFKVVSNCNNHDDPYYLTPQKVETLSAYDYINTYIIKNSRTDSLKSGRFVNVQDRADAAFKYATPIFLNKGDTVFIYFAIHQIRKPFALLQPLLIAKSVLLYEYDQLAHQFTTVNFMIAGAICTLVFIIILNLLFYFFDKNKVYLYYSCFLLSLISLMFSGFIDFAHPYWVSPLSHWTANTDLINSIHYLGIWAYLKSTTALLHLEREYPSFYKIIHRFAQFLIAQIFITFLLFYATNETVLYVWVSFLKVAVSVFGLVSVLFILFKIKTLNARIISLGNILFLTTNLAHREALTYFFPLLDEVTLSEYCLGIAIVGVLGEILCISLVIALSTMNVYRENVQLILIQQKTLLEKQEMRRQLANDFHDDIGASLSSVALLSERMKALIKDAIPEAYILLNKISTHVRTSIENTQTIVWAIDMRYDKLSDLISLMKEFGSTLEDIQHFYWKIPNASFSETIELTPELKKNLYLIFKESVNNAVKYAQSDVIAIEIGINNDNCSMRIQDFGKGFERQIPDRGLGLYSIENRAKILRGSATIDSELNKGTTINVEVPLT